MENHLMSNRREILVFTFVILAIILRLLPHPPNFTPLTSLSLFGGVMFKNKWVGMSLPIVVMFTSDIVLGFYSISFWVYGSFILISFMGTMWKKMDLKNIVFSTLIFFIITNLGVWIMGYPLTVNGLIMCYTLALPFLLNSLLGDLFFGYLLKWTFKFFERKLMLGSSIG